jgi:hypothetical protein
MSRKPTCKTDIEDNQYRIHTLGPSQIIIVTSIERQTACKQFLRRETIRILQDRIYVVLRISLLECPSVKVDQLLYRWILNLSARGVCMKWNLEANDSLSRKDPAVFFKCLDWQHNGQKIHP